MVPVACSKLVDDGGAESCLVRQVLTARGGHREDVAAGSRAGPRVGRMEWAAEWVIRTGVDLRSVSGAAGSARVGRGGGGPVRERGSLP